MEGYIDVHNHGLFGVDDGAGSLEESLAMLRMAYEDGIRTVVFTPHAHYRRGHASPQEILEKVELLRERVAEHCPGLRLFAGNELYYDSEMPEKIENGEVCRLADSRYVLVEFSPGVGFSEMKSAFREILSVGVVPILAHVERYECFYEDKDRVPELWENGVYFQANASGVMGDHGNREKKLLKQLLKKGYVQLIATDAHDTDGRSPLLSECVAYVRKKYGEDIAQACFRSNPEKILNNQLL